MANINNVINILIQKEGTAAQADNPNIVCVMTDEQGVLSSNERYREYLDVASVGQDFGTSSDTYAFASAFFGTDRNSVQAGGAFVVGFYRSASETLSATNATIKSAQLDEDTVLEQLRQISDGSFKVTVDGGVEQVVSAVDFRTVNSLDDVVTALNTAIADATVTLSNSYITVTSDTAGATSTLTYLSAHTSGTFIGTILTLSSSSGGTLTQGVASQTLTAETKVEALTAVKAQRNFKGVCFIDTMLDAEVPLVASWAQSNETLVYETFQSVDYLEIDVDNPVWTVKLSGQDYFRCLYSKAGNRQMSASYMAYVHSVDFTAENSALTMHLKELSVPSEEYSQTEIQKAYNVGLDIYTTIKNTNVVLTSGANDFVDNIYNLMAYKEQMQVDVFNVLKGTSTKIAQTTAGVNKLVDQCEKTTAQFVKAGVFAGGTWTSPDFFGNIDVFKRNIEQQGFYFLAGKLSDQSNADRQARKSPTIQGAVKNSGALHKVNLLINFQY